MDLSQRRRAKGETNVERANPLKSDPELCGLLRRLDKVKKYKTFNRWKSKFVGRLGALIYEKGMDPAEKACNEFSKVVKMTVKCADKVVGFIDKGELSSEKKTVKASLALSELTKDLTIAVEQLEKLIPSTGREEKKMGFTKYHLGAVLIRQNFHQYITLTAIDDLLDGIAERIQDVADRQQLELFQYYKVKLKRFCDIMADLNLYEIMLKCVEFQEAPDPEESSDEEPMMIEIEVADADGGPTKIIKLEVEPSDKIGDIKNLIAEDIGIEPDKQVIKLKGKELDDPNMTMAKAGVTDKAKLTVEPLKIPVTVKTYDGKTIKLMVDPNNYLSDVKRMLEPESGIPPQNQKIFKDDMELADDNKKVDDYGIKPGTVLYMEPSSMTINVEMPDGTKHKVDVSPSDTTEQVKAKIEAQTGMAAPEQILKHKGKEIPAGKKLKDVGIKDGDDIQVDTMKVPVTVKTKDGKEHKIMVAPSDKLGDIKKQLQDMTGIPVDAQILCKDGKELTNDNKTASDLGIKAGTTLTLDPKSMTISIKMPDGTTHKFEIDATDKAADIKKKVAATAIADFLVVGTGKVEINTQKVFGTKWLYT